MERDELTPEPELTPELAPELTAVLDGRWSGLLRELRAQMAGADVRDGSGLPTEEYRRQVFDDLHLLVDAFAIPAPFLVAPSLDGGEVTG